MYICTIVNKKQIMLEQLRDLLKQKQSNQFYADRLGTTPEIIKELKKELKEQDKAEPTKVNLEDIFPWVATGTWEQQINNDKGTLQSSIESTFEPKNDLELAELHKIDLTKYKISSYWSKLKPNGNFTSSIFATLKKPTDYTAEDFAKFLENYKPPLAEILFTPFNGEKKEIADLEISLADFHLAKKTLEGENLENKYYDFISTALSLLNKANKNFTIRKLVFPISNDFFHTDNYQNQTTNLTPQDVLTSYDQEYELGFKILSQTISYLAPQVQELEVILVQGNHDRTKSFYVAHALEIYFKDNPKIKFQREHSVTKSVVLGNTFIGYHHGNCKIDDLPLLFATGKDAKAFGNADFREVHTGDKHHYMAKEIKGVRIQQMPSLSGTDRWHLDNNFVNNIRAGLALVYTDQGKVAEFEHRI